MIGKGRGVGADAGSRLGRGEILTKTPAGLHFSEADATMGGAIGEGQTYLLHLLPRIEASAPDEWVSRRDRWA